MCSVFDSTSDFVVLEIVSWLLVFRGPSRKRIVRDVLSFGRTCRRFHSLVQSPELWTNLDVGALAGEEKDEKIRSEIVGWFLSHRSMIVSCKSLCELDSCQTLDLIRAMPNLESVTVKFRDEKEMGQTFEAIESLGKLETLRLCFLLCEDRRVKPLKLPPTVHRLSVDTTSPVHGLLDRGPFRNVRDFCAWDEVDLPESLNALPELEDLEINKYRNPVSQRDIDAILRCHKLTRLAFDINVLSFQPHTCSFSGLETAPWAKLLTIFNCYGVATVAGTCELICRCCPNIEIFRFLVAASGKKLLPSDIVALASLAKLDDLSLSLWDKDDSCDEFSESFAILGQAPGATAFQSIDLSDFRFDPTAFFSSHRMTALKKLALGNCEFPESSVRSLIASASKTLESIDLCGEVDQMAPALLEGCPKVTNLRLDLRSDDVLKQIGQCSIAPLKKVQFFEVIKKKEAIDAGLIGIAPAFRNVEELHLGSTSVSAEALGRVVDMCPNIRLLSISEPLVKDLKRFIRPEVEICH